MAVNTKKYKMLPWKGKKNTLLYQKNILPARWYYRMQAALHDYFLHNNILGRPWNSLGEDTRTSRWNRATASSADSSSQTQGTPRETHPPCWQGGTQSLRAGSHATTPKLGPRKRWEPGSKRTIRFPGSLPKKARDRPQEVCERLLMFTHVFSQHRACIYRAAIWLQLPCSWLQSSRSADRGHLNAECLVHG